MILASLTLPWPQRVLWPNGSTGKHWTVIRNARARQKSDANTAGLERGLHLARGRVPGGALIGLHWTFQPPPRSRPDDDNAEAAMKAARDQIAAMLGVDDGRFRATREFGPRVKGGAVIATVSILPVDTWQPIGCVTARLLNETARKRGNAAGPDLHTQTAKKG